jgi:hypothetical protein
VRAIELLYTVDGMKISSAIMEISMESSQKTKNAITI